VKEIKVQLLLDNLQLQLNLSELKMLAKLWEDKHLNEVANLAKKVEDQEAYISELKEGNAEFKD